MARCNGDTDLWTKHGRALQDMGSLEDIEESLKRKLEGDKIADGDKDNEFDRKALEDGGRGPGQA